MAASAGDHVLVQRNEADPALVPSAGPDSPVRSRFLRFPADPDPGGVRRAADDSTGALVVVLLRNVVGIATFGTFMPVLVRCRSARPRLLAEPSCSRSW
jgi:hypothetical protein